GHRSANALLPRDGHAALHRSSASSLGARLRAAARGNPSWRPAAANAAAHFPRSASFMPPTALRIFPPALSAFPSPSSFLSPLTLPPTSLTLPLACLSQPFMPSFSI